VSGLPAWLALAPAEAAGYLCVSVRDSGSGILPENMPRIFEPFFTTKSLSARRGTGLGLSMAYELAKKLDAGLAVESAPEHGSTFILILPIREKAHEDKSGLGISPKSKVPPSPALPPPAQPQNRQSMQPLPPKRRL